MSLSIYNSNASIVFQNLHCRISILTRILRNKVLVCHHNNRKIRYECNILPVSLLFQNRCNPQNTMRSLCLPPTTPEKKYLCLTSASLRQDKNSKKSKLLLPATTSNVICQTLTLLHSEWPKLYRVLAVPSATGLKLRLSTMKYKYLIINHGETRKLTNLYQME